MLNTDNGMNATGGGGSYIENMLSRKIDEEDVKKALDKKANRQ